MLAATILLAPAIVVASDSDRDGARASTPDDDRLWVRSGLGLGGGSDHMGALSAKLSLGASAWWSRLGIEVGAAAFAGGEPDGGGADGKLVVGSLAVRTSSVRTAWTTDARQTSVYASIGAGAVSTRGYERSVSEGAFSHSGVVVIPRAGVVTSAIGVFAFDFSIDALVVPTQGAAVLFNWGPVLAF